MSLATTSSHKAETQREELRLLPRALHRYDLKDAREASPNLQDSGLFAFVIGTDPEAVLVLEAGGSGGLAIRLRPGDFGGGCRRSSTAK